MPPKAYLSGQQDFYGRNFFVSPAVLIPRPESEMLVDAVLNLAGKPFLKGVKSSPRKLPEHPRILDVGTGSGCLAITLKLELPEAEVSAVDVSEDALGIAKKNADFHRTSLHLLIISDLLEKVNFTPDVIVANLPYVDKNWDWLDLDALSYEPALALFAEENGLYLIKKLLQESKTKKVPYLVLEADPSEHETIINYAKNLDYRLVEIRGFALVLNYCG